METNENNPQKLIEYVVRLGTIGLLLYSAIRIIGPFVNLTVWGIILAVALGPVHLWLIRRLKTSSGRAATILTIAALLFVVGPSFSLGDALATNAYEFAGQLKEGKIEIPPPPATVKEWPVVGERFHKTWTQASTNIDALLARSSEQIVALGRRLLATAGSALFALLQFAGSIILAGFLLGNREASVRLAKSLFRRVAPQNGEHFVELCEQTVRGVAAGVLGVAIIQSTLVGIGLMVAGVPYAGVFALLCLLLGIVQLPMAVIVLPLVIYQFMHAPTTAAALFAGYMLPVMLLDNVLKPILMGRGVEAPMLVIFVGALGGMAANGFIGLFTGAIILVLVYELIIVWLNEGVEAINEAEPSVTAASSEV